MAGTGNPSIDHLEETWRSLDELLATLADADWKAPTGCPGWSVQDNVSHLVDYEHRALLRPPPDHVPADLSHTKNALGEMNEVGVDARRGRSSQQMLAEYREVTAARLAQLRALTADDLAQEMVTPAGPGTVADMLTIRVMDTWSHEQDIRRALGRPGHETGPAATEAVTYLARALPMVVGKRAAAPEGATIVVDVGGVYRTAIRVNDGRARQAEDEPHAPTVSISMPASTFAALTGGRSDVPDDVVIEGDRVLGEAIVANLAFLP